MGQSMPPVSDKFAERGANTYMLWPAKRSAGQNYSPRAGAKGQRDTALDALGERYEHYIRVRTRSLHDPPR